MADPNTPAPPPHPTHGDTSPQEPEPLPGGGVELFPVNFTAYQHPYLPDLDTERHVREIADLLAPYRARTTAWAVPADKRDRQAVEDRLALWSDPTHPPGRNTVLYWVGHGSAGHLAHHRTPAPITNGVTPADIAQAIGSRQLHPDNADTWAIVVLDACFSQDFARAVHLELFTHHRGADRYLLLSTAAQGPAELGTLTRALRRALHVTFPAQPAIGLLTLGRHLATELGGFVDDLTLDDHRDQLVNQSANAAAAISAPLDQIAELQAVIDQLPADEQRHFLPKASGAELGELAWYFHGRSLQRDQILRWLATATHGTLIVTGPAGAGKSALLGHVLLHTNTRLYDILTRHGHLTPLPPGTPRPDDPFDLTAHLAGLTPARTFHLIAAAAGLPDLAQQATEGRPPADLTTRLLAALRARDKPLTLLLDALDEADQPLVIADQILRPLAALPQVRIMVGTRRSTREGPDQPTPTDTDLLDALHPHPAATGTPQAAGPQRVEVTQDPEALAGYLNAKLHAAKRRGTLHADEAAIADAVHRLVTDNQHGSAEPQHFLYVRLAAHEILADPDLLTDPTPLIGRTHRQLFTYALQRLDRTDARYTPLLRALGLAQGRGLPDQDGIWATAADALTPDAGDTHAAIAPLVRDAAPYLALDHESGQSVYRLAHRTFTEHFTTAAHTPTAHAHITRALTAHTHQTLMSHGTTPRPQDVNSYTRRHLTTHARLGHTAGALHTLADHVDVLDTLDLTTIITNAFHGSLDPNDLPPALAGTILLQHHAQQTDTDPPDHDTLAWRRWWRRLGTTYIQGTPPPPETHSSLQTWPPTLTTGTVRRRQLHLELTGHTGGIRAVEAFTAPDGTPRLATVGNDRTVRVWDPTTGTQAGEPLVDHTGWVNTVTAFTAPDGTPRLATTGLVAPVRIWNPATGIQDGPPFTGDTGGIRAVAAFTAPDGTPRLATVGNGRTMRIWDPTTGTQVVEFLTGHTNGVMAFTAPDGTPRLATAASDGTMRIWDPTTGTQVVEFLTGHTGEVAAVAAFTAPDGTPRLATAGIDGTMRIWDPTTHAQVGEPLAGHTGRVYAMTAFTAPDGTPRLATTSNEETVRIWDPATGTQDVEFLTGHFGWVRMATFTAPDGTPRLATAGEDQTVRVWGPATITRVGEPYVGHTGTVRAVAAFTAPDGTPRLATAGEDQTVRVWDPATGTQDGESLIGHTSDVTAVAAFTAPDGTPRLATTSNDQTVRIWNPATGTQDGEPLARSTGWTTPVAAFTAPDGTPRLATTTHSEAVRIWNPATHAPEGLALKGHTRFITAIAAFTAPDGTPRLATTSDDRTVRVWDPATDTQVGQPLTGHTGRVNAVAAFTAPDGTTRLATTASDDRAVRIWNPATGAQVGEHLTGHTGRVNAVAAFTAPDGTTRLATAGDDQTVRIWNPANTAAHTLPLADRVHTLTELRGLLIAGTDSGYLAIDISSVPIDIA
ncbi:AAA family ATPase [Kitasatospora sp. NPDC088783]|uniref:AAA family ATPase n=1 Tax=Kitasatospora sp. NPDC088783 TaxID=3364077 RepID=UPI0038018569